MKAIEVYNTSDGLLTKKYYDLLSQKGPLGQIAVALFRAQKCSDRAKQYHKRSWREDAYQRKTWSIGELGKVLFNHTYIFGINYGWKTDPNVLFDDQASWVFYIDLPEGQVSFHCKERGKYGPDYLGEWDGIKGMSQKRVLEFCDNIFSVKQRV